MYCISAITMRRASWYTVSSSQCGFREDKMSAILLCSLKMMIWRIVSCGFWLTLISPVNKTKSKFVFYIIVDFFLCFHIQKCKQYFLLWLNINIWRKVGNGIILMGKKCLNYSQVPSAYSAKKNKKTNYLPSNRVHLETVPIHKSV